MKIGFLRKISQYSVLEGEQMLTWTSQVLSKLRIYLIANVDLNPCLEVVKDLFQVPRPGSSQVTCITVRLEKTKQRKQEKKKKRKRTRGGEEGDREKR